MDNEKMQRLEDVLKNLEDDILAKTANAMSGMEGRIQEQFAAVNRRLDGIEKLLRELARG